MKNLIALFLVLASFNQAMACISGSEYYSVITPRSLNHMNGAQDVVVGDVLVLSDAYIITKGAAFLKEMGFNDAAGFNSGKYYLVKSAGSFELTQTYDKVESKMTYVAKTPARARGASGCADFRRPASVDATETKVKK